MLVERDSKAAASSSEAGQLRAGAPARVSSDMEEIFGAVSPKSGSVPLARSRSIVPIVPRLSAGGQRPVRRPWLMSGVVLGAAFAAAIVMVRHNSASSPAKAPAPVVQTETLASQGYRLPTLVQPVAVPPVPQAAPIKLASGVSPRDAVHTRPSASRDLSKRKAVRRIASKPINPAPRARRREPCDGIGRAELARCMRPQLVQADSQLRDAYYDAVHAGVDRGLLVAYRNRWAKLRDRALTDPRQVTARYRQMAQELDSARVSSRDPDI